MRDIKGAVCLVLFVVLQTFLKKYCIFFVNCLDIENMFVYLQRKTKYKPFKLIQK